MVRRTAASPSGRSRPGQGRVGPHLLRTVSAGAGGSGLSTNEGRSSGAAASGRKLNPIRSSGIRMIAAAVSLVASFAKGRVPAIPPRQSWHSWHSWHPSRRPKTRAIPELQHRAADVPCGAPPSISPHHRRGCGEQDASPAGSVLRHATRVMPTQEASRPQAAAVRRNEFLRLWPQHGPFAVSEHAA